MKPVRIRLRRRLFLFMLLVAIAYLFPLLFMGSRSVSLGTPGGPHLEAFRTILGGAGFGRYALNSLLVLLAVVAANLLFSVMVGYAFARYRFPLREPLFMLVLVTLMVPKQTLMIPILDLMVRIGLQNTLWALILPFCVDGFNVFLVRQFILGLPPELEDAARADGAGEFLILRRLIFPLCRPALAVVVIHTAIVTWNSFLFPLILVDSPSLRTLPVGLSMLTQGPFSTDWGVLMAGAAVTSLPLILLFAVFQEEIIEGMTSGALRE